MPYGFSDMWSLKKEITKENKNRLIEIETQLITDRGLGVKRWVKNVRENIVNNNIVISFHNGR